jgi:dienelactone hydrolase
MNSPTRIPLCLALIASALPAAEPDLDALLKHPIIDATLPLAEVRAFCQARVPPVPEIATVPEWERYADRLRRQVFDKVVLRGEAAEWAERPSAVELMELIEGGPEYDIRKLRYEIVPDLWAPALLYEPKKLDGKVPVMLAVNGHDGAGKAAPYKQVRCINLAKRGMLVLNVEWLNMGQLRGDDFVHYRMNQLDLCGTSGLAPFYLAMSRALDVLLQHANADPQRVAVSGLSGGGWQTIVISALDTRVTLSNPVAGYSSFITRAGVTSDLGDSEQTPCDLATVADYAQLTAIRAPRPTLLTFNDRDRCCFAAGHALPPLLDAARPAYQLYGKLENLVSHVNHVPGSHNYDQDNREAFYRMVGEHFYPGQAFEWREIECTGEVKTAEQLNVPLPEGNAGFNTLAKGLSASLPVEPAGSQAQPPARRSRLAAIVHAHRPSVTGAEAVHSEQADAVQATSWKLRISDTWTVPAVELTPAEPKGTTVVIADGGRAAAAAQVQQLLTDGQRVVAVDPFYFGESKIATRDFLYGLLVAAVGERPLGIQADQVGAVCRWLSTEQQTGPVTLVSVGRRTGLIAAVAAALEDQAIAALALHQPLESLKQIIDENKQIPDGPEMFCFGLLKEFDLPHITALVAPRPIQVHAAAQ